MKITFITENMSSNSTGRTYCLWLLAEHLGWSSTVLTTLGEVPWTPIQGSPFAESLHRVDRNKVFEAIPSDTDLIVAVKPLARSLGLALRASRRLRLPVLVDIDDPDLELRIREDHPLPLRLARLARHPVSRIRDLIYRRAALQLASTVSNPWLQERYGGVIIPHVRPDYGPGRLTSEPGIRVVFVGTNHRHKGVQLLRTAVQELRNEGFELTVTDEAPNDATPWENWVGQTSLEEGIQLVRNADIVALPSLAGPQTVGQLPAKLIDAMILGRAIAVADVDAMPWAVGDAGLVFQQGSLSSLKNALTSLRDPHVRRELGERARARALSTFSVDAVAPAFERACLDAVSRAKGGNQ